MSIHKKAQTCRDGLFNKLYPNHTTINIQSLGRHNRIPSEKEIINGWWDCLNFFKERERLHQETARWYFNYSREMEQKAGEHIDLAGKAHTNYKHYLDLLSMATLKRLEKSEEVQRVA